jgi:Bacterial Ig-like domain
LWRNTVALAASQRQGEKVYSKATLSRLKLLLGLALVALALAPATGEAKLPPTPAPQLDTATATGRTAVFHEPLLGNYWPWHQISVNAHSGPSGENPGGSVSFGGFAIFRLDVLVEISGPVTCLNVTGNKAIIKFDATLKFPDIGGEPVPPKSSRIALVDNGGSGLDQFDFSYDDPTSSGDCSGEASGQPLVADGRAAVFDAQPASTAPSITSTVPTDGFSGASRTAPIVVTFDQAMDKPSAEGAFSLKRAVNGEPVSGAFSWSADSLLFTPSAPLAAARLYKATLATGARNLGGTHLEAPVLWQFTTTPQPLIAWVYPADQATGVSRSAPIVVGFDTAMDKPSAQAAFSLKLKKTGAPVSGSFGWYGNALIFKPSADLAANTFYEARETNAAKNLASRPLASGRTWGFTTAH